jgi:hypothetical protein
MKSSICSIFLIILTISTFGQKIDNYIFTFSGAYLPGGGGQTEYYFKTNNKPQHISTQTKHGWRYHWKHKKKKFKSNNEIIISIDRLDSLFRLTEFKFTIKKSIIDSIKARNDRSNYNKIPLADINKFFSHGDTIILNLKEIKQEQFEGMVIDGFPYWFDLSIIRQNQDTIKYKFEGNFCDDVQTSNIKNWIPVYLAYREKKFMETMPMEDYFTDKNLESVLRRFIIWTKEEQN